MNVLVVDDDPHFSELLRAMLMGEGFRATLADHAEQALVAVRHSRPDILLLTTHLGGASTLHLLAEIRRLSGRTPPLVVAMTGQPGGAGWGRDLGVSHVFTRPFSILDLLAALRNPAELSPRELEPAEPPTGPAPPIPAAPPRVDTSNLAHLVRLWARRATGILTADGPDGAAWVTFAAGGPLDQDGLEAILGAARGGELEFQPCDVDGSGRAAQLGERLWHLAWAAVGEVEAGADFAPGRTRLTEAVDDLPVPASLRAVLRGMTHGVPVSALIETQHLPADEVRRGFRALALMGLVHLAEVTGPARRTVAPEPEDVPTRVTRDPLAIRRLRRELQLLKDSDPWVVLGVPRNSPPEIVARAGTRMTQRYGNLARDGNPLVRELSTSLLERIEWAIAEVAAKGASRPADPARSNEEDAFQHGQRAMSLGDWAQADRWFTFAHERNLDSARFLAHLGWVRFHNPDQPVQERVAEGVDFLLLAEQIDPNYADGQYFLAMALHRQGDDEGAMRRLRRALKSQPDHVAAAALARKLRRPAAASPG